MKINLEYIIKKLDILCFLLAIVGALPLILFEYIGVIYYLEVTIDTYLLTFICLFFVLLFRFIIALRPNVSDDFKLTKGELIHFAFHIILCFACIGWFIFMLICI